MSKCIEVLDRLGIDHDWQVISAHRDAERLRDYIAEAPARGIRVFIGGAGMSAHLPGAIAALTALPVIGVPLAGSPLNGLESLLSISQMPPGVPVATVAIGDAGAKNAAYLAAAILALSDEDVARRLEDTRAAMRTPKVPG
jgi:phosphoribosylaminoimidazole carboxylase PurE protein